MFLPLMKKALMGGRVKTGLSLAMIRYSAFPLVCYITGAEFYFCPYPTKNKIETNYSLFEAVICLGFNSGAFNFFFQLLILYRVKLS